MNPSLPDHQTLRATIVQLLSRELKVPAVQVKVDAQLTQYGLDSIAALTIAGELEDQFDLELPSTLLWDCPTINALAEYLHDVLHPVLHHRDSVPEPT